MSSTLPMKANATVEDRARCFLLLIWQSYSAAGHSHGRSSCAGLLEHAIKLLQPPRSEWRKIAENSIDELIKIAEDIEFENGNRELDYIWENVEKPKNWEDWKEKMRKEIESGFENRMA